MVDKDQLLEILRQYGDSHSNKETKLSVLQQNLRFLETHGTKENAEERYNLTKNLTASYKVLMTEPIGELQKRHTRKKMTDFLIKVGYKDSYLRKKKYDSILRMHNNPKIYEKYGKRELNNIICNNYGISRATVRNWNFEKTMDFFKRDLNKNYSSVNRKKNDINNYLMGLTSSLFCDLIRE